MNKHTNFILKPISTIIADVVSASRSIGNGIEGYPLSEYIMQSVFLKMTGFQEQKMKCICWDLATDDYEYRYRRYSQKPLGECSSYDEKKIIYKDLIELITKRNPAFQVHNDINKVTLKNRTVSELITAFSNSNILSWAERNYMDFSTDAGLLPENQFATSANLLENVLQQRYALLYKHRNRCAHNTLSYQENLPTLESLRDPNYIYDNYFVRFALLTLIDKIFVELYQIYHSLSLDYNN